MAEQNGDVRTGQGECQQFETKIVCSNMQLESMFVPIGTWIIANI